MVSNALWLCLARLQMVVETNGMVLFRCMGLDQEWLFSSMEMD